MIRENSGAILDSEIVSETDSFAFLGLGLIGGSIARGIRKALPGATILAYDPDLISLKLAVSDGVVDHPLHLSDTRESSKERALPPSDSKITTSTPVQMGDNESTLALHQAEEQLTNAKKGESLPISSVAACRVIFLAAPVLYNEQNLQRIKPFLTEQAILTDTGSVKGDIHKAVNEAGLSGYFVGGHPMAGSERIGYRNSKSQILENAYYILTPEENCPAEKTEYLTELVRTIGALPLVMTPDTHDFVTAAVSHLPHVVSAALVNLVKENDSSDGIMKMIAAGGFKDITRISSSSPEMWEHICLTNPDNIKELLDKYIASLTEFRAYLGEGAGEAMRGYFASARAFREGFPDASSGPIKKVYDLYVDIEDQPGVIAEVAVILANRQISIKNLGITHNREEESGVLRVEFHDEKAEEQARFLLISKGYTVH